MFKIRQLVVLLVLAATSFCAGQANAQRFELSTPGKLQIPAPDLPEPDNNFDELYDYKVEFAGPPQTGYMMINDRGVERGPFNSYEEAHAVGMQTPWVYFWVEQIEHQTWYQWGIFDTYAEANQEAIWLRSLGFWARINAIIDQSSSFR